MTTPLSPGRVAVGAGLIVFGTGSGMAVLIIALLSTFASLARIDVSGSRILILELGLYTVFWEIPDLAGQEAPLPPISRSRWSRRRMGNR
jgi:hypothetical protein